MEKTTPRSVEAVAASLCLSQGKTEPPPGGGRNTSGVVPGHHHRRSHLHRPATGVLAAAAAVKRPLQPPQFGYASKVRENFAKIFRGRDRGRRRAALSSEHTLSPSPTTSTPGTSQVAPTIPPATAAPSPQPAAPDAQQVDASPQLNADSSHASQPDPPAQQRVQIPITWDGQKGFDPDNNYCTQAISEVIELMVNEPWLNYSEIPEDVQKRWFEKRGLSGPQQRASRFGRPSTIGQGGVTS
ncbi:hypothetical protein PIB30_083110 [Stylosanthes scabra]|uniref:Uncharacterized protein n=1 Tax=Stylosanthes scabra TaxID=79078 RepID=A0ABU6UQZ8_9FABA|nr:hypothetical protein [Stylosanthes scabra]